MKSSSEYNNLQYGLACAMKWYNMVKVKAGSVTVWMHIAIISYCIASVKIKDFAWKP
jgi:hypothetical protein